MGLSCGCVEYEKNPEAMHLRGMNMLFEGLKEKGSMIVVPSSALETMSLGAISGMAALSHARAQEGRAEPKPPEGEEAAG